MASFRVVGIAVSLFVCLCLADATTVRPCKGMPLEKNIQVNVKGCQKPPCTLKKKTNATIEIKFQPSEEVSTLVTKVNALIGGFPVPFVGVDGKDACKDIHIDGNPAKVGCPLKPEVVYLYENSFPVYPYYPNLNTIVHWSLMNGKKIVVCFQVAVKITN